MEFDFPIFRVLALEIGVSVLLALLAGPLAIKLATRLGAIDIPGKAPHKKHRQPTPLAGGLVLLLTLPVLVLVFGLWKNPDLPWILAGAAVIFIFGLLDDLHGLSAAQKFSGQGLAVAILIIAGVYVGILEGFGFPLPRSLLLVLDYAITLFWIVGITNAFNLIDSMDGLVAGLTAISSGFFTVILLASGQTQLAHLTAILFGLSIGLYYYNRTPARFFLGDSGVQTLGFLLASIGILYTPPGKPQGSTWFLPILLLAVPIFDTTLVVVSRLRRHRPVFDADRSHTYHRLARLGLSSTQAVALIHLSALLLCIVGYLLTLLGPGIATVLFIGILLLGVGLIIYFEKIVTTDE